jgi:hypothetical protein
MNKREVVQLASAHMKAQVEYAHAFSDYLREQPLLPIKRFWELVAKYRGLVIERLAPSFAGAVQVGNATERAADEFFRIPHAYGRHTPKGVRERRPAWNFDEAIQFANHYGTIDDEKYKPLFDVVKGRGDDAYGDLLDSLTLLGPEFHQQCLDGLRNNEAFEEAVALTIAKVCPNAKIPQFTRYVLRGENYNAMHLREMAQQFFAFHEYIPYKPKLIRGRKIVEK